MDYEKAYKEALERARIWKEKSGMPKDKQGILNHIFPELRELEDEMVRKAIICGMNALKANKRMKTFANIPIDDCIAWLEKQGEPLDKGEISDGYHTFNELYYYRMLYNAAFFNLLPKEAVHKSKRHHNGEECFGGGWFIVMANLPTGQISNHYELKDWDLFQIPEKEVADEWDGHTPQQASERLYKYLLEKQGESNLIEEIKRRKELYSREKEKAVLYAEKLSLCGRIAVLEELLVFANEKQGEQKPILNFKANNWYVSKVDGKIHDMTYNPTDMVEPKDYSSIDQHFFKSTDKVEPKFHEGDWVVDSQGLTHQIEQVVENVTTHTFGYDIVGGGYFNDDAEGVHLWTIQDAKDGDVLATENFIFIFKNIDNGNGVHYYCHYEVSKHEDDNQFGIALPQSLMGRVGNSISHYFPATKEQRDTLFKAMADAGWGWDAEEKDLKITDFSKHLKYDPDSPSITKQKPSWSEEDEEMLTEIIADVKFAQERHPQSQMNQIIFEEETNWLKSIKDRITWKPSEGQMKALEYIINNAHNTSHSCKIAKELLEQLKKLTE